MKKIILYTLFILFTLGVSGQVTNKDIEIRKTTPALKLNGTGALINFYNGDVTITRTSDKLTVAGGNIAVPNILPGYSTTATAAGTTTLTVASNHIQIFTGSTTQTVKMPVVTTLALGHQFFITNNSTGAVTVTSSGGNSIIVLAGSTTAKLTCVAITGTGAASWTADYSGALPAGFTVAGSAVPATLTAEEIGYNDGVTSLVQTQIDEKANVADSLNFWDALDTAVLGDVVPLLVDSAVVDGGYTSKFDFNTGQALDVKVADTINNTPGNYVTRQNYHNDPTHLTILKNLVGFGSTIKGIPVAYVPANDGLALTESRAYWMLFYLPETTVITGIKTTLKVAGIYVHADFNGAALYSISGTDYTRVALSKNMNAEPNIWEKAAATLITIPMDSTAATYTAAAGYYYVALVHNENDAGGETAPQIYYNKSDYLLSLVTGSARTVHGFVSGQTTLPTSEVKNDITDYDGCIHIFLY